MRVRRLRRTRRWMVRGSESENKEEEKVEGEEE